MATVHRTLIYSKRDPMAPENIVEHIRETSRRLANQDGSPTSVHAAASWRAAYERLWKRLEALQDETIPFMAGDDEEGGQS